MSLSRFLLMKNMCEAQCTQYLSRVPAWVPYAAIGVLILGLTVTSVATMASRNAIYELNVGFVGNAAILATNDVPRLMEAITNEAISQQSCLHGGTSSLANILETGNGMYKRWTTNSARIEGSYRYDYGLCTVQQLFFGQDEYLESQDANGVYYNDGKNPCFQDDEYLTFINSVLSSSSSSASSASSASASSSSSSYSDDGDSSSTSLNWDYVILADQSKRMAFQDTRNDVLWALEYNYFNMFKETGAIPVILEPHAFWSSSSNMTGLEDVPTFASLIYEGAKQYRDKLIELLPRRSQRAVIAPVGSAFLTVHEENIQLWNNLTASNNVHASTFGSYLLACVVYATLYGKMPPKPSRAKSSSSSGSSGDNMDYIESLFVNARTLEDETGYPSGEDGDYLWKVAQRVVLQGHLPETMEYYEGV